MHRGNRPTPRETQSETPDGTPSKRQARLWQAAEAGERWQRTSTHMGGAAGKAIGRQPRTTAGQQGGKAKAQCGGLPSGSPASPPKPVGAAAWSPGVVCVGSRRGVLASAPPGGHPSRTSRFGKPPGRAAAVRVPAVPAAAAPVRPVLAAAACAATSASRLGVPRIALLPCLPAAQPFINPAAQWPCLPLRPCAWMSFAIFPQLLRPAIALPARAFRLIGRFTLCLPWGRSIPPMHACCGLYCGAQRPFGAPICHCLTAV